MSLLLALPALTCVIHANDLDQLALPQDARGRMKSKGNQGLSGHLADHPCRHLRPRPVQQNCCELPPSCLLQNKICLRSLEK